MTHKSFARFCAKHRGAFEDQFHVRTNINVRTKYSRFAIDTNKCLMALMLCKIILSVLVAGAGQQFMRVRISFHALIHPRYGAYYQHRGMYLL